jgi:Flp pilus assembly pilin Flp
MIEYGLIAALVPIGIMSGVLFLGDGLGTTMDRISRTLEGPSSHKGGSGGSSGEMRDSGGAAGSGGSSRARPLDLPTARAATLATGEAVELAKTAQPAAGVPAAHLGRSVRATAREAVPGRP